MLSQHDEKKIDAPEGLHLVRKFDKSAKLILGCQNLLLAGDFNGIRIQLGPALQTQADLSPIMIINAKTCELAAKACKQDKQKQKLLTDALNSYKKVIALIPEHVEAQQESIRLQMELKADQASITRGLTTLRKAKQQKEEFSAWHKSYNSKRSAESRGLDSVEAFYGYSALRNDNLETAHFHFEQAISKCPSDFFSWCCLAEIYMVPKGPTKIMDVDAASHILDYLIAKYDFPLAFAIRSMLEFGKMNYEQAFTDLNACLKILSDYEVRFIQKFATVFIFIFNKIPYYPGKQLPAKLADFRAYLLRAKEWMIANNPTEAYHDLTFSIYLLHCIELTDNIKENLATAYFSRCETSLLLNFLDLAEKDLQSAKKYAADPQSLIDSVVEHTMLLANKLVQAKQYPRVAELLVFALELAPNNGRLLLDTAMALKSVNSYTIAGLYIDKARKLLPDSAQEIDALQESLNQHEADHKKFLLENKLETEFEDFKQNIAGEYTECIFHLEFLGKQVPADLDAFDSLITYKASKADNSAEVIKFCDAALIKCPQDFFALTKRAYALLAHRDLPGVLRDCNAVIEQWEYGPAYWVRGNYYLYTDKPKRAREDFIKCLTRSHPTPLLKFDVNAEAVEMILNLATITSPKNKLIIKPKMDLYGEIEVLKCQLTTNPADAEILYNIGLKYFDLRQFDNAKLYISLAMWVTLLTTEEGLTPYYVMRCMSNALQENASEAYRDMSALAGYWAKDPDSFLGYSDLVGNVTETCLRQAYQALEKKDYLKAKLFFLGFAELVYDPAIDAKIAECEKLIDAQTKSPTFLATAPPVIIKQQKPRRTRLARPALDFKPKVRKPPVKLEYEGDSSDDEEKTTHSSTSLQTLAAENEQRIADKRQRAQNKYRLRKQKKRQQKLEERKRQEEANATQEVALHIDIPVEEAETKTAELTREASPKPAVANKPPSPPPSLLSPHNLRRYIPKKINFPIDSIAARIILYIKKLEVKNSQSYASYLVGGAVTDMVLHSYHNNLQAQLAREFSQELADLIEHPMFDRMRYGYKIDDYDFVTQLPLSDMEAMGVELNLTPIPQPLAGARSFVEDKIKIDLLFRPQLVHLEKEIAQRLHGSLFLRWDNLVTENQTSLSFDLKDPSHQGINDLSMGILRALDPKEDYKDLVKILFAFYQETKRRFQINSEDQKIIAAKIPTIEMKAEAVTATNAQLKKLFLHCHAAANYQKLIKNKLFDTLFSPYLTRCLEADSNWLEDQMQQVSSVPLPRLKRIYAILIVSIAMQELSNELLDDLQRGTFFWHRESTFDINLQQIYKRCRNIISRYALFTTYFANEKDGDINHHLNINFLPLIMDWRQKHASKPQGFFSAYTVKPSDTSPLKGLSLLINTSQDEDGMDTREPASPLALSP